MGGEQLYAVKWYKDDQEFFRYMPGQTPATITFPVAGVHLVTSATDCGHDHCKVRLHGLTRDHSGGAYRCEISSEAPTFRLASETHNVTIAALPKGELRIEGLAPEYLEGEPVNVDCVSELADPAPILSWYINGHQAPSKYVGDQTSSKPDLLGLVSRSLSLRFNAERKFFHGEKLEISCRSSLPGIPVHPQIAEASSTLRSQPAQPVINNQKLHWLSSTVANRAQKPTVHIVLLSAVRWLVCILEHIR
ncbi:CD80-like C2-set immunoglobulin domain [Popillia japonica]|uniref:CD80-like C2-set immunoglobulin domain n=1 Tax=Popillia japonica TaxID=7064 RepID=A0AAW1N0N7_POPJA